MIKLALTASVIGSSLYLWPFSSSQKKTLLYTRSDNVSLSSQPQPSGGGTSKARFQPWFIKHAEVLLTTWFPCPISCLTHRFPSLSDPANRILFIFSPISRFPVTPLFCFERPRGLLVPDLCLNLQRAPLIYSIKARPWLRGEHSITQLLIWEVFHIS